MERFLDNSIFSQVTELHVTKCFPRANHCDVCAETLHAGDVISKAGKNIEAFNFDSTNVNN